MKQSILKVVFAVATLTLISSCDSISIQTDSPSNEAVAEQTASVDMEVEGMVCAMGCAKYIEEKVADLDGVLSSEVNFEEGTAHFQFDQASISSDDIQQFINDMHDGQYQAKIAKEVENNTESGASEEEYSSVKEQVNITFPELFTYFIKRLK